MKTLRKIYYLKALSLSLGTLSSKISFYVCVMVYIFLGNSITAEKAFVVLGYYHTLRSTLTIYIPLGISQLAELRSSLVRIKHVMMAAEATVPSQSSKIEEIARVYPRVILNKATVNIKGKKILEGVSMEAEKGLTIITGNVGSGKSALLGLILKDIAPTEGTIDIIGSVSYASQEPWLFPGSIRQNILFGEQYNKERYDKVIEVCCLRSDLDLFPKRDFTIAGDRGLNLSKGQQARINLARAIYKDSNIYLLDDCLSALDTHVSQHVFEQCVKGFLKNKICILVTHYIQHLQQANKIIVLNDGIMENVGSFKELEEKGTKFKNVNVNEAMEVLSKDGSGGVEEDNDVSEMKRLLPPTTKKVYSEEKEEGKVNFDVYRRYFSFGGGIVVILSLLGMFIVAQASSSYSDILIGKW